MFDETERSPGRVVSPLQRTVERRVANPLLRGLLRSPLHRPASRWLVLVSYVGRRSGDRHSFPAVYARAGGALVVVTPAGESNWWHNFTGERYCTVWLRGSPRSAVGEVLDGERRASALAAYLDAHPALGRLVGARDDPDALAVVRFAVEAGRGGGGRASVATV